MNRRNHRSPVRRTGPTPETVETVWERDRGTCVVCKQPIAGERGRDWSVQHRLRRGAGGTRRPWVNLPGNLVLMCGDGARGCHGAVTNNPTLAAANGYRVVDGQRRPADTPILHAVHGRVLLADDGTWTEAP